MVLLLHGHVASAAALPQFKKMNRSRGAYVGIPLSPVYFVFGGSSTTHDPETWVWDGLHIIRTHKKSDTATTSVLKPAE